MDQESKDLLKRDSFVLGLVAGESAPRTLKIKQESKKGC